MLCSAVKNLKIVQGDIEDYHCLETFHYRHGSLGPFCRIFAIRPAIGVIVYSMPVPGSQLRNIALDRMFDGLDRTDRMSLINSSIRCISRVIIAPRYRGLGIAARLVSHTMPLLGRPIIEAMAVMGQVNPFFEKAGMIAFHGARLARCEQMAQAMNMVAIEQRDLLDAALVHAKILSLAKHHKDFIERQMIVFLQCYGKRRNMEPGIERTRFVLSKLSCRPVYYIKII